MAGDDDDSEVCSHDSPFKNPHSRDVRHVMSASCNQKNTALKLALAVHTRYNHSLLHRETGRVSIDVAG